MSRPHVADLAPRGSTSLAPQPIEAIPLDELVTRWSQAQARPCACGGVVMANVLDPTDGVRAHQMTERHATWSERVYG